MITKALFVNPDNPQKRVIIEDINLGSVPNNTVRVKPAYSYISAGTELTQLQMGRVNMKLELTRKQIGYSLSGIVVETAPGVSHVNVGDSVVCIGQGAFHATMVDVPKNLVVAVPSGVSLKEAAPMAMMCFALEGVRKAELRYGENTLVLGAGPMGQIAAQLAYQSGSNTILMDIAQRRLDYTPDHIETVLGNDQGWEYIQKKTAPEGIEAVLVCFGGDASAVFDRIKQVMACSPDGICQGCIVFSGGATLTVNLASPSGNLRILSSAKAGPGYRDSQYELGQKYPLAYVQWTVTRNMKILLDSIEKKRLAITPLITHTYAFKDALKAYTHLAQGDTDALMVLLDYA